MHSICYNGKSDIKVNNLRYEKFCLFQTQRQRDLGLMPTLSMNPKPVRLIHSAGNTRLFNIIQMDMCLSGPN